MRLIKSPIVIFSIVIGIFVIYAAIVIASIWPIDSKTIGQAGVFGDSFGILTSLFSGLAFAGLIVTIWQQQEELSITRDEIRVQHFENLLFKMLDIHNGILAEMDVRYIQDSATHKSGDIICTGRECFSNFYDKLTLMYKEEVKKVKNNGDGFTAADFAYLRLWDFQKRDLGHYFRYLYNIFKFINAANIENKKQYSNLVRAQLSEYELVILFYNGLSEKGKKFKPLIEQFHLLNNLPEEMLLDKSHKDMYASASYL